MYGVPEEVVAVPPMPTADVMPADIPDSGADVMAVVPSPDSGAEVMAAAPAPDAGAAVMATGPVVQTMGPETSIADCMVQHSRGELDLCEQCAPGFFQYYDLDGNILCLECAAFSPSCKADENGLGLCQSFQGCPVCDGDIPGVDFDTAGTEFDVPGNNFKICAGDE